MVNAVGQVIERGGVADADEFGDEKRIRGGDELSQSGAAQALRGDPGRPEYVGGVGTRDGLAGHLGPAIHQYMRVRGVEAVAVSQGGLQGSPSGRVEWNRS